MSLLELTPHHAGAMATVHEQCFVTAWGENDFRVFLKLPTYRAFGWVGQENELQAFMLLNVIAPELELSTICVNPKFTRKGIAFAMLTEALKKFDTFELCFLEVSEINSAAIALYSKTGFLRTGIRKNYYKSASGGSENAILMSYPLK
ncbi:MAG: GNAT family N-acetyltransferase [Alphaproteobacteria bacterium TMED89]|nr:hypothetical protein [Rhodospirillaceae bacterium]RPH20026.1 MAG: GNAT family N-acetyltransferase [Alphaproteobacteria bacterium TMED89]